MLTQVERPGSLEKILSAVQSVLRFLAPFDMKAPWVDLALINPWYNATVFYTIAPFRASYRVNAMGRVEFRGTMSRNVGFNVFMKLPLEIRPKRPVTFRPYMSNGSGITFAETGEVFITGDLGGASTIALDGVTYDLEP